MRRSAVLVFIDKMHMAIASAKRAVSRCREEAAQVSLEFNEDLKKCADAYETYKRTKSSEDYDAYATIYQRMFEAKGRIGEIKNELEVRKRELGRHERSLETYERMLATAEDDPAATV